MAHIICNRRRFLGGLAAGLMATPFLPRFAGAGTETIPKRIVFVFSPNGTVKENWLDWNASGGPVTEHSIDGIELGEILAPLEPYRQEMLVMRGINMDAAYDEPKPKDHWPDYMNQLTGRQPDPAPNQQGTIAGISFDQYLANEWSKLDGSTPIPSVQLGIRVQSSGNRVVSASGAGQELPPDSDPYNVFLTMFDGMDLSPAEVAKIRAKRGRMLDAVTAELHSAECQLVGHDRVKLQKHLEALEQLETSLNADVGQCALPEITDINHTDDHNLDQLIDQQFLNLHTMLACGLTRVATVMMGDGQVTHHHLGHNQVHHYFSHNDHNDVPDDVANSALTAIENYYARKFKEFLDLLAGTEEVDGSRLLDHTLVIWCHEQSTGGHLRRDMPYVFACGSQSPIQMGRVIHAGGDGNHHGSKPTVNDLWITIANSLGLGLNSFGDPAHVNGPLTFL